jgi:hypothetical protein
MQLRSTFAKQSIDVTAKHASIHTYLAEHVDKRSEIARHATTFDQSRTHCSWNVVKIEDDDDDDENTRFVS